MTADDLRITAKWAAKADAYVRIRPVDALALADLIDAVAMFNEPVPIDWPVGYPHWRRVHERALDSLANAFAALDQEAPA